MTTGVIIAIAVMAVIVFIFILSYLKAPPDKAFIVTGLRRRVYIGKAGIRLPFLERVDKLSLELIPIDVRTQEAIPTADFINIFVDAAVNIKVSPELRNPGEEKLGKLDLAAQHFLGRDIEDIKSMATEVLEGNMREIVGKMSLRDMVLDRQTFANLVRENAAPDLAAMGLDIVSFNVQNFKDPNGVIENMGIDNTSKIKKDAAIARATAEKEIAVAQADADRASNEAKIMSQQAIALRQNELDIKNAELKKVADTARADADAAYKIRLEAQRKTLEVATAEANLAKLQKETEVQTQQVELTAQTLDAEVKKRADAELYAKQKAAEADLFSRQKEAEAQRFAAEQEAAGIEAKGRAEATAIEAKALAEATGIEKKAEAMTKMGQAAVTEMVVNKLPEIFGAAMEPMSKVGSITMWGEAGGSKLIGDTMGSLSKISAAVKETLGIDLGVAASALFGGKLALSDVATGTDSKAETKADWRALAQADKDTSINKIVAAAHNDASADMPKGVSAKPGVRGTGKA